MIAATPMHDWKPRPIEPLEKTIDELRSRNCYLQHECTVQESMIARLEIAVRARDDRVDALRNKLDEARARIRALDRECEHLAAIAGLE